MKTKHFLIFAAVFSALFSAMGMFILIPQKDDKGNRVRPVWKSVFYSLIAGIILGILSAIFGPELLNI